MKVLHIFNSIEFSGAETMYAAASEEFQNNGFELYALSTGKDKGALVKHFEEVGFKVFHIPFIVKYYQLFEIFRFYHKLIKFYRQYNIDVVHIHRGRLFLVFVMAARYAGIKKIIRTVHSQFSPKGWRWWLMFMEKKQALKLGVTYTSVSSSVLKNEKDKFKIKSYLIPNWVDGNRFFKGDLHEKYDIRKELQLPMEKKVIITVGSCQKMKRHEDVIRAVKEIRQKREIDVFYLHIGSGLLESDEKKLASKEHVREQVLFAGNQSQIRKYLVASDVFVMPSDYEGAPLSVIEAMFCGIPVICYDSPGLDDLIINNQNGFLVNKDFRSLAAAIEILLTDSSLWERIARVGMQYAKKHYAMKTIVTRFIELYKAVN